MHAKAKSDRPPATTGAVLSQTTRIAVLLLLTAVALRLFTGPASFDLSVPWVYRSDGLAHAMLVKTLVETGGYLGPNFSIGATFGASFHDYSQADVLNYALMKAIAAFSDDWVVVFNVFLISGFLLAALTAFPVLQRLGFEPPFAMAAGLLFAFLPYHVLRISNYRHIMRASYYAVPLAVLMALRSWSSGERGAASGRIFPSGWLSSAPCSFSAGLAATVSSRSWRSLISASLLAATHSRTTRLVEATAEARAHGSP